MSDTVDNTDVERIKFCFDVISPYSWFALEILLRYEKIWNVSIELLPIFGGGIMKGSNNTPPAMNKFKAQYSYIDAKRQASWSGVPYRGLPINFMAKENTLSSLLAQRTIVAACQKYGSQSQTVKQLVRSFFNTFQHRFSRQLLIEDPQLYIQVCRMSGLSDDDSVELVQMAQTQPIKDKLKENTSWALERGAFGMPTMFVEKNNRVEYYFGGDRIEHIAIQLQKPWFGPQPHVNQWISRL
eukprot:TRINITY_DN22036_c4_g1_i1.p2 TRINITY_DN22036_c4_g1~~TRINITY_DN22036_c4_g1_i1.p2  ORF type:complete len:250 (+),score=9.76 TRINITY_DN22036_c4_g1_i1:28-750(+)